MKRGREPLKDTIARNAAALRMYAASAPHGKSREPLFAPEPEKPKRAAPKPSLVPHESTVQAEIIDYLKSRPDIGCIVRMNSGTMNEGKRFIRMNTIYEPPLYEFAGEKIYPQMADLQAIHKPTGKKIAIEVKRAGWKAPSDKREHGQALYLKYVRDCNGIAFFATSVADVERGLQQ